MATYQTDFSEYTSDVQPSDWTERWNSGNGTALARSGAATTYIGADYLEMDVTTNGTYLVSWDDIDADAERQDSEVLIRVRTPTQPSLSTSWWAGVVMRGSGSIGSDAAGYAFYIHEEDRIQISRFSSGTSTFVAGEFVTYMWGDGSAVYDADEWIWMRCRVNGSNLYMKVWLDGMDEPDLWTLETTDTNITGDGWVGVTAYDTTNEDVQYDFVSVATNGDTAPYPDVDTSVVTRVTAAPVEVLSSDPSPQARVTGVPVEVLSSDPAPVARVTTVFVEVIRAANEEGGAASVVPAAGPLWLTGYAPVKS